MRTIFVFGSNLAGRHGAGAAKFAREHHGAIRGRGEGLQGDSYAIPTKDGRRGADLTDPAQTLSLGTIAVHVERFLAFAAERQDMRFNVTAIGCGRAGYKPSDIAPLFAHAPRNCILPPEFARHLAALRSASAAPLDQAAE